jgi:hypothetical protein
VPLFKIWTEHLSAWLDRASRRCSRKISKLTQLAIFEDPEAIFQEGWLLCDVGAHDKGMSFLERGVERGYLASPVLKRASQFDPLRERRHSSPLVADAEALRLARARCVPRRRRERLLGRVFLMMPVNPSLAARMCRAAQRLLASAPQRAPLGRMSRPDDLSLARRVF